jgi:CBS domain-containing protein
MTKNPVVAHSNVNLPGAIDIMTTKSIGNLIVIENEEPVGVFTEREILSCLYSHKQVPSHILLRDIKLQPFCSVSPTASVLSAAKKMISNKCRILVLAGKNKVTEPKIQRSGSRRIEGIITASDMVRAFSKQADKDPQLKSVITKKLVFADCTDSIYHLIELMHREKIGSIIIVQNGSSESKKLYGIFTERDLLSRVLSKDVSLYDEVRNYCSTELITAHLGITALEAAKIMRIGNIKRLPLIVPKSVSRKKGTEKSFSLSDVAITKDENNQVKAIVTAKDLVDVIIKLDIKGTPREGKAAW